MKRIVLTGGGTAGHVTPNIALLPKLRELGYDIHYIGSYEGIEKKLIEDVNKKYGNTVIMVTHNEAIKNMADHVIKLRDGAVRHNDINTDKVSAEELEW